MPDDLNKLSKQQLIAWVLQLVKQVEQLTENSEQLQDRLARLEKNSSNSSKPPSSDIIDPQPKNKAKRKRKIGGQRGHKKHTRQSFNQNEIDKTIVHALPDDVIKRRGLVAIDETESALQQIDLPNKLFKVTEHRVQLYRGPNGEIIKAKLPADVRQAGLFSPRRIALTGYLKARGHMSYSTLQAFDGDIMTLDISQSYLAKVCTQKLSIALQPAYAKVAEHIRNAPVVGSDETGHKNPAFKSAWTWCQQTCDAVFFHISNSRGSKVLVDILGADFNGTVICDYFSANKKFVNDNNIPVQFCFAHLIRDIKFLTTLAHQCVVRWATALLKTLKKIFKLWKARHHRHSGRYKKTTEKLKATFLRKVRRSPAQNDAINIRNRFDQQGAMRYVLFLEREGIEPTNNRTEQAIRFVVLDRRVTQGTRSDAGMRFCERAWTVVATCTRHQQSVYHFFLDAITATLNPARPYPAIIPEKV